MKLRSLMVTRAGPCLCRPAVVRPSQKEELCLLTLDTLSLLLLSLTWWKRDPGQMMSARQHLWLQPLTSPITHLPPWVQSKSSGFI